MFKHYSSSRFWVGGIAGTLCLWMLCFQEFRYWWWGEVVSATIVHREEFKKIDGNHERRLARLLVNYSDSATGQEVSEPVIVSLGGTNYYSAQQTQVRYIPGVSGKCRPATVTTQYLALAFFVVNVLFLSALIWGWRMARADTWAWKKRY